MYHNSLPCRVNQVANTIYISQQITDGGGVWRDISVNISAYHSQKIRIYFDQRLDGIR